MNEQQRFLLISNRNNFGSDLRSEDVFSYLQSKFVLSLEEIELIRSEKTSQRRTKKLLSAIPGKGSSAFVHFHDALKDAGYDHLADLLTSGLGNFSQPSTSEDEDDMPSGKVYSSILIIIIIIIIKFGLILILHASISWTVIIDRFPS